jgi:phage shock protein PspC (stress-responsive transcriptional regulator)
MNKVITINLNGVAYQLEENGFEALRAYLDSASRRLGANPDKDEIMADIEQAIAEKFRAFLGANKTVVVTKEVEGVIGEMGPVEDASGSPQAEGGAAQAPGAQSAPRAAAQDGPGPAPKRLYKISDGAMLGGVCNGLAAYFNIDVTIVRILFAIVSFFYGAGVLLYLLMMLILPSANTPAEMAAAQGVPPTAQDFIRRARAGYYGGLKTFGDKRAYREWKRRFKQEIRGWRRGFHAEMHQGAQQFHQNWHQYWSQRPQAARGAWFAILILTLLSVLITLVCVAAVISLIATGAIFGILLPTGIPLWLGVILLILAFQMVKWPLRAMRHAFCHGAYGPAYGGPILHLWNSFFWLGILALSVWYMNRHSSEVHEAVRQIRPHWHHAVDSFKQWWDRQ